MSTHDVHYSILLRNPSEHEYRGRTVEWCRFRAQRLIQLAMDTGVFTRLPEHLLALRQQESLAA